MNDKSAFPLRLHNKSSGCRQNFEKQRLPRAETGNSCPCLACPVTKSPRCRHSVEWRREIESVCRFADLLAVRVPAFQTIEFRLDLIHYLDSEEADPSSRRGSFDHREAVLSYCSSHAADRRRWAGPLCLYHQDRDAPAVGLIH